MPLQFAYQNAFVQVVHVFLGFYLMEHLLLSHVKRLIQTKRREKAHL